VVAAVGDTLVMVVYSHRKHALCVLLADDVFFKIVKDFSRGKRRFAGRRKTPRRPGSFAL
jgi:hypothetical protein